MKKSFYFALALTAGLFASCSSDEIAQAPSQVIDENAPAEIKFNVGADITVTRGTGTVGINPTTGVTGYGWAGQTFSVYMLDKGKLSTATQIKDEAYNATTNPYVYENAEFTAPDQAGDPTNPNGAALTTGVTAYYPTKGQYDFWAYRVDDAGNGDPILVDDADLTTPVAAADADYLVAPIQIDGSQDVMVAETTHDALPADCTEDDVFSAKTGRRNLNPTFNFKHLLTRLTFKVKADNIAVSDAAPILAGSGEHGGAYFRGFKVTKITVRSANTGNLIVAYKPDATTPANDPTLDQRIVWDQTAADWHAVNLSQTDPDNAAADINALPELLLQSRQGAFATAATGAWTNIGSGIATAVLDGSVKISLQAGSPNGTQVDLLGTTMLWDANSLGALVENGGRPDGTGKTAAEWQADAYAGTLYYWDEWTAPTRDDNYQANAPLATLAPVVPHWDEGTPATYKSEDASADVADESAYDALDAGVQAGKGDAAALAAATVAANENKYFFVEGDKAYKIVVDVAAVPGTGAEATSIGEALLVAPAPADGYLVTVYYSHYKSVDATHCALDQTGKVSKQIVLTSTGLTSATNFKRAKQYNITIKLYKDGTADTNVNLEDFGDDNEGELENEYSFE